MPPAKRVGSRIHQASRVIFVENIKIGLTPQIAHQNEALLGIACENLRHVQARILHERINLEKRIDRFFFGRRIHHDISGPLALYAEVATETRIGACRRHGCQIKSGHSRLAFKPTAESLQAFVLRSLHHSYPHKSGHGKLVRRIMAEKAQNCSEKKPLGPQHWLSQRLQVSNRRQKKRKIAPFSLSSAVLASVATRLSL